MELGAVRKLHNAKREGMCYAKAKRIDNEDVTEVKKGMDNLPKSR
jgi:hypothetical protein